MTIIKMGFPLIRPIIFFDQEDTDNINKDHEFLCGEHLLVCPVVEPKAESRKMYLPKGNWYNYWNKNLVEGKREIEVQASLEEIPLFVQAGAIIPNYPLMQYVGEKKVEILELGLLFSLTEK